MDAQLLAAHMANLLDLRPDQGTTNVSFARFDDKSMVFIEKNAQLDPLSITSSCVYIGRYSYFQIPTTSFLTVISPFTAIGRHVSVGMNVALGATQHHLNHLTTGLLPVDVDVDVDEQPPNPFTVIQNDVWIGINSTILGGKGIVIGHGACIGAGSVVTKSVPPYAIVAGNPARIIRYRFDQDIIDILLKTKWWTLPIEVVVQLPVSDINKCCDILLSIRQL